MVLSPGGALHELPQQFTFGFAGTRIESGRTLGYTSIGLTPAGGVVGSYFVGDDSSAVWLSGLSASVTNDDLVGTGCAGRMSGLLEWKTDRFEPLCRDVDSNGVTTSLRVGARRLGVGFTDHLDTDGPIALRVEAGARTITTLTPYGLLRRVVWGDAGLRFDELARLTPPKGVRLRGAVQLDDEHWLVMGTRGSSWVERFTAEVGDLYLVTSHEMAATPGTLLLWKVQLTVAPRVAPTQLRALTIAEPSPDEPFRVCWPDGATTLRLGPVTPSALDERCGELPRFERPDGTFFVSGTAPRVGDFSVMRPNR